MTGVASRTQRLRLRVLRRSLRVLLKCLLRLLLGDQNDVAVQQLEASSLREAALARLRLVAHLRETLQNKLSSVSLPQIKHAIGY